MKMKSQKCNALKDLKYSGPIHLPSNRNQDSIVQVNLTSALDVNSATAPNWTDTRLPRYCQDDPDWADFSNNYGQVRCLGMEVEYIPYYNGTYSTEFEHRPLIMACQHVTDEADLLDLSTANFPDVLSLPTHKVGTTSTRMKMSIKARGTREMEYVDCKVFNTTNGWPQFATYTYSDGVTPSFYYGKMIITYLLEFKGRI